MRVSKLMNYVLVGKEFYKFYKKRVHRNYGEFKFKEIKSLLGLKHEK